MMDQLECILHTVRLIWVEFMNKFYHGAGIKFDCYDLNQVLSATIEEDDN